jgi:hypothetical protein
LARELDVSVNYLMVKGANFVLSELENRDAELSAALDPTDRHTAIAR